MPKTIPSIQNPSPVPVTLKDTDQTDNRPPVDLYSGTADQRLVIEPGPRPGSYVYKTVDRITGETIRQLPREEVVKLIEDPLYATGTIARTRA